MSPTIKTVFEDVTKDVVIDAALITRLHEYERAFVNRNTDHIEFFGGNLMGVNPMRFRPSDRDTWFEDVLQIDELSLEDSVHAIPGIPSHWVRANDVMNLSCVWLLHAIQKSHLSPALKEQGSMDAMLVLQYKFLGSLMAHNFPYPADKATMLATYAKLSRKYALKVAGSWSALLQQRAKDIYAPRSIHRRTIDNFAPDMAIINMVSDIQGRLKEIVKKMNRVFYETRQEGAKIGTDKSVQDIDGENIVKDKTRAFSSYIRYIHTVLDDRASFIRKELVQVVTDAMHTMPPRLFVDVLEWMSINHRAKGQQIIEEFVDETLLHAFSLIVSDPALMGKRSGLTPLIVRLRSLYMASRMSDPALIKCKALAEEIVSRAISTKNASVVASVRTGCEIYIVLRAMAREYYTQ